MRWCTPCCLARPFDASELALRAAADAFARQLLATPEECRWAARAAFDALQHPLLRAAAASPDVRREAPVAHLRPDGTWVEGVIDLAFRAGDTWHVVELKTDETIDAHREEYLAQTQAYVAALRAATGCSTVGTILSV